MLGAGEILLKGGLCLPFFFRVFFTMIANKYEFNQKSESVKDLQRALRECLDRTLTIDGHFGSATLGALKNYQKAIKVPATGLYSGETQVALDEYIARRFLNPASYEAAANILNVSPKFITEVASAIAAVESRGFGFLPDGRLTMLFERHWFRRYLSEYLNSSIGVRESYAAKFGVKISHLGAAASAEALLAYADAKYPSICSKSPGGYTVGTKEHDRHTLALGVCAHAAYNAASYGKWQIMGFNAQFCGYTSSQAMYTDMSKSETNHLKALVKFFKANPNMIKALQAKNYAMFARLYNGPNYAINKYDQLIARELGKFGW